MAAREFILLMLALATGLGAHGCVYHGGTGDFMEGPGTPLGITALRIPVEKLVLPPPPPAGFSSTYQKMLLDRQRIARKQAERDAQEKASDTKSKDIAPSPVKSASATS